jgi:hypothetical protein
MTSAFDRQLAPCAGNSHSVRRPPVATRVPAPLIPRAIGGKAALARKLEHETQAAFLETLVALEEGEESLQLQDSLAKADRELAGIRQALFLMVAIFILSLVGLTYCTVLLPQRLYHPTHFVTMSFSILGLASLIAQLEFSGYLLWRRMAVNRLHKECRRRVLLLVEAQLSASPRPSPDAGKSLTQL